MTRLRGRRQARGIRKMQFHSADSHTNHNSIGRGMALTNASTDVTLFVQGLLPPSWVFPCVSPLQMGLLLLSARENSTEVKRATMGGA